MAAILRRVDSTRNCAYIYIYIRIHTGGKVYMAVSGDYLSVTLKSGFTGNIADQAFFYKFVSGSSGSASDLAAEFRDEVVPLLAAILQNQVPIRSTRTVNLFNNADWEDFPITPNEMGTRSGEPLPPINVVGFLSAKPTSSQQPARKRFGAISEADVTGNGIQNTSGYFAALDALAVKLGEDMVTGTGNTYEPIIVKRIAYTAPSGKKAYRLPENSGEGVDFPAIGWGWSNVATSQITRKLGRGA